MGQGKTQAGNLFSVDLAGAFIQQYTCWQHAVSSKVSAPRFLTMPSTRTAASGFAMLQLHLGTTPTQHGACLQAHLRDGPVASEQACIPAGCHVNTTVHHVKVDLQRRAHHRVMSVQCGMCREEARKVAQLTVCHTWLGPSCKRPHGVSSCTCIPGLAHPDI